MYACANFHFINFFFAAARPTPTNSATNSLEKHKQKDDNPSIHSTITTTSTDSTGKSENSNASSQQPQQNFEYQTPTLNEDYAELGLGDEEGDYSTPAARNYELDRLQIQLNEIIGVGQFGDVHIGTCRIKQNNTKSTTASGGSGSDSKKNNSSLGNGSVSTTAQPTNGDNNNDNGKTGMIHVAVKTCKADADMTTSEKFLEEACRTSGSRRRIFFFYFNAFFVFQISCKNLSIRI